MILSFAWTTPAVLAGEKNETRRDWSPRTIATAQKKVGQLVKAYDRSPRFRGQHFGWVRLLEIIPEEDSRTIPDSAWEAEGFHFLQAMGANIGGRTPIDVWRFWKEENDQPQTVVRFELARLTTYGAGLLDKLAELWDGQELQAVSLEWALEAVKL